MTDKDPRFDFEEMGTLQRELFAAKGDDELLGTYGGGERAASALEARIAGKVVACARSEIPARTVRRGA